MPKRDHEAGGRSQRQLRVGEELRHVLAHVLERRELRDPALQDAVVTVTEVRVSPDLKNATAFVMPLGGRQREEILGGLRRGAPFLRSVIAREINLRFVPALSFELDTSFDHASRISELLQRPEVARDLDPSSKDEDGA